MIRDRLNELKSVEEVLQGVAKIEDAMAEVKKKHSEILFSPNAEDEVKQELDDLTAGIKRTSATVNAQLKELSKSAESDVPGRNNADARIRKSQYAAASRRFMEAMKEYYSVQEEYRDRCRDRIHRQLKITGKDPTEEELDKMLESDNLEIFTQGILTETLQARQQLADIEERHQEIIKLETSLRELLQLFQDIAIMVHSQGEMIDNIASHVTHAEEYVSVAKEQTGQALKYQSSARKKKIILGIILLVVLAIIIILIAVNV